MLRYVDKSSARTVELRESRSEFLVVTRSGDAEGAAPMLRQNVFRVTPSASEPRVYVLRPASETESLAEIDKTVARLRTDPAVEAVAPALLDDQGQRRFALPNRVVVQLRGVPAEAAGDFFADTGARVLRPFRSPGLYEVVIDNDVGDYISRVNASNNVVFAEPSYYGVDDAEIRAHVAVRAAAGDAETLTTEVPTGQWNLTRIAAPDAWEVTRGRADVVVAVVDGWPDSQHEALERKFLLPPAENVLFAGDRSVSSHATNVCGVIAGETERLLGVASGLRLLPLVIDLRTQLYAQRADAIRWAASLARDRKIDDIPFSRMVLSCSWRTSGDIAVIREALVDAAEAGIVIVFSAGNDATDAPHYPSDYSRFAGSLGDAILSVAATDSADRKASYSNYSPTVDVAAPGGDGLPFDERDILCADQNDSYVYAAGTSIAVPHVAAIAGLILSINSSLSTREVKRILADTVDDIREANPGLLGQLGSGRVNAARAVAAAQRTVSVSPADDTGSSPSAPQPAPVDHDAGPSSPTAPGEVEGDGGPRARVTALSADDGTRIPAEVREALEVAAVVVARYEWVLTTAEVRHGTTSATVYLD